MDGYTVEELTEKLLNNGVGRLAVKRAYAKMEYEKHATYRKEWQRNYYRKKKDAEKES